MFGLVFGLLTVIALLIIGGVMAPKAGPAKGRVWLGLTLLIIGAVVGLIWQTLLVLPAFFGSIYDSVGGPVGFGVISSVIGFVTGAMFIAGVAILASAATLARDATGYLDPTRPGAPPISGYPGAGYQPAGDQPTQQPGTNPYA